MISGLALIKRQASLRLAVVFRKECNSYVVILAIWKADSLYGKFDH